MKEYTINEQGQIIRVPLMQGEVFPIIRADSTKEAMCHVLLEFKDVMVMMRNKEKELAKGRVPSYLLDCFSKEQDRLFTSWAELNLATDGADWPVEFDIIGVGRFIKTSDDYDEGRVVAWHYCLEMKGTRATISA